MTQDDSTRDRVRALVREVLANAGAAENEQREKGQPTRFISIAPTEEAKSDEIIHDESAKQVITEDDVRNIASHGKLRIANGARFTALAADIVKDRQIEVIKRSSRSGGQSTRMVAIGSDHGGFKMKETLKSVLHELGQRVHDFGTNSEDAVDYPDFAHAVARSVSDGTSDVGIIIDGAGVGSAMTANKVPGVRAAACYSVEVARNSREHNGANVLTLGSKTITDKQMREIVAAWLSTDLTEERHRKRVAKIDAIQRQYQR